MKNPVPAYLRIGEITGKYPETAEWFLANGFEVASKEELEDKYGGTILNHALKQLSIEKDLFMSMLNEQINSLAEQAGGEDGGDPGFEKIPAGQLDFAGPMICILRNTFRGIFDDWMSDYREASNDFLNCYIPANCGSGNMYRDLWRTESIDDFPGAVTSCGIGDFFRKEFVERMMNKGYFKTVPQASVHPSFVSAGLPDPDDEYTLYSVYPYIMLVDHRKLGDLPIPRAWSDLLHPAYENQLIVLGSSDSVSKLLLLTIYKEHGEEGLRKLARTIKDGWHSSKMAKIAGTPSPEGAAIYYLPWAFAEMCPHKEHTSVIWPEDGAIVNPLYMLVKASEAERVKPITDFITGAEWGQIAADNFVPGMNAAIDNGLPEGASFKWLGWDYLKANDMNHLMEYTHEVFMDAWRKKKAAVG